MFQIEAIELKWFESVEDERMDLCLHGRGIAQIGDETFECDCTVSSTALYLLKSLTEDHPNSKSNQMFPCCGFSIYPCKDTGNVDICGCPNGVDWSVIHDGDKVRLVTEAGKEVIIAIDEYREAVYSFADKIESFYSASPPKMPYDEEERIAYTAFWDEWKRRRK